MALRRIVAMLAALALAGAAAAQPAHPAQPAQPAQPAKPLFAGQDVLRLTITGPVGQIARNAQQSRTPRDATLTVLGTVAETHPIQLSARGITRRKRDICQFPPLRVRFKSPPAVGSVFAGQNELKLVTHCRPAAGFQQHLLLEYAAYRLYNRIDPQSFRARLASIDYVDDRGRPITTRLGFFIEEIEDVAARNAMVRAPVGQQAALAQLSPPDSARVALFEYMIGNLDWSIRASPPGDRCCHNSRLIARPGANAGFVPVPYDFDYSGLVGAPYSVAPDGFSNVRQRRYQGYCVHNAQGFAAAARFRAQRGPLLAVLDEVPLDPSVRRRAAAYLDGFFADIADDRTVSAKVLRTCAR